MGRLFLGGALFGAAAWWMLSSGGPRFAAAESRTEAPALAVGAGALARYDWLVGTWERRGRGRRVHETWEWAGPHVLRGSAFVIPDAGERRQTECIVLTEMAGDVFYLARPAENAYPTPFKLVAASGDTITFENPEHDFPQRVVYWRHGSDSLMVAIEGPDAEKGTQRIEFKFGRVQ